MKVFKKDTFEKEAGVFWNGGLPFQRKQSKGFENADFVCIFTVWHAEQMRSRTDRL